MKFAACLIVSLATLVPSVANATPRQLPFTYPNETLSKGEVELEMYTDVNPLRVQADPADAAAGNLWTPEYKLQTEIEYGLSDRFELGLYQVFEAEPQAGGDNVLKFDGLKWRIRTRLAQPGELPVDVGFYFELETMHDELSFEAKINLQRRLGNFKWMANLWAEESITRPLDTAAHGRSAHFIVNPTTGFVYEVTPTFQPGVEYWARGQLAPSGTTDQDRNNSAVHHFVGPTIHLNFGRFWWSVGAYLHLNDQNTPSPGDSYGPVWFRSVIGLEL
jgi:hypothetical protein